MRKKNLLRTVAKSIRADKLYIISNGSLVRQQLGLQHRQLHGFLREVLAKTLPPCEQRSCNRLIVRLVNFEPIIQWRSFADSSQHADDVVSSQNNTRLLSKTPDEKQKQEGKEEDPMLLDYELPYRFETDYAKSGRSKCKSCKEKIPKGTLRIATLSPSPFGPDGGVTIPHWFHIPCLFKEGSKRANYPSELGDVCVLDDLRSEDQDKLTELITLFKDKRTGLKPKLRGLKRMVDESKAINDKIAAAAKSSSRKKDAAIDAKHSSSDDGFKAYCVARSDSVKKKNPDMKERDVVKELEKKWAALSDRTKQKYSSAAGKNNAGSKIKNDKESNSVNRERAAG